MELLQDQIQLHNLRGQLFNSHAIDILRLDLMHPIVSGNKWFKLKCNIQTAFEQKKKTIATFGGAYSNHIVATAYACQQVGLKSIGIIRGEKSTTLSPTLDACITYGMELHFVSREGFRDKAALKLPFPDSCHWVEEGGYGPDGMKGAGEILKVVDATTYSHIICSCGTGTMMAGLINVALPHQTVIGISALKNHTGLETDIKKLLPPSKQQQVLNIFHGYHFGGYAKHPKELIEWMAYLWQQENLPTDIVYTSKMMYAVKDLCHRNHFPSGSKLLIIHSGGLQGNLSLPINILPF